MTNTYPSPHTLSGSWSDRISDRYRCHLSPILADWYDRELWKHTGRSEYREPLHPEALINAAPESIWPGLMCCDLLPIISNTAGDWLCVRVTQDNVAAQIVQWYHGGGDWIPWGNDLAEAIVFDALVDRFPGASRRHAIPAENPRPPRQYTDLATDDPILRWALDNMSRPLDGLLDRQVSAREVADELLDAGVAEVAVRCELVQSTLMQATRKILEPLRKNIPDLNRTELAEWTFDIDRIPPDKRVMVERHHRGSLSGLQDWMAAEDHSRHVTRVAPELAWGWDIAGYAAERRGDLDDARQAYRRAAQCSVFTDQSIRLETHWLADVSLKFAAARLMHLAPDEVAASPYLSLLCGQDVDRRRSQTVAYWTRQASEALEAGDYRRAHRGLMSAGWDVGAEPIGIFADLLDKIGETADLSGQAGRAEIARTHRRCLRDRYSV